MSTPKTTDPATDPASATVSGAPVTTGRTVTGSQDIGLLILRLTVGLLLAAHGAQKLFGWFDGAGLDNTAAFLGQVGYSPAKTFAVIAGLSELGGGLLFAAGLLTPLAAAAVTGTMVNAVAVIWAGGLWAPQGYEYPLVIAAMGATVAFTGPGSLAVDSLVAHRSSWLRVGMRPALAALALGLGVGALTLLVKG